MPPKPGQATHGPPYMIGSPRGMLPSIQSVGNFLTNSHSSSKHVPNAQPPLDDDWSVVHKKNVSSKGSVDYNNNKGGVETGGTAQLDHDSRPPLDHDSWPPLDHDSHAVQAGPSHTRPTVHDRLTEGYASVNSVLVGNFLTNTVLQLIFGVRGKLFDKCST